VNTIYWYDTIPVVSWFVLNGRCRHCNENISWLYPFIEVLTAIVLTTLYVFIPHHYFIPYFIFISALIVIIRSDIETMLISQYTTLFLVPVGLCASWYGYLPISFIDSGIGVAVGYLFLYAINGCFKKLRGYDGIGEGDFDLLCLIGSFTGIIGCWASVTLGSMLGSLYGITIFLYEYSSKQPTDSYTYPIPFGPFLAIGALIYIFFRDEIGMFVF
jgi:leader peptidase (prepilin peptidase)/N-methyltransferase